MVLCDTAVRRFLPSKILRISRVEVLLCCCSAVVEVAVVVFACVRVIWLDVLKPRALFGLH